LIGNLPLLGCPIKCRKFRNKINIIHTDKGEIYADLYIMCLGSYSPLLSKDIGVNLLVYPVKGYSMSIPITDNSKCPIHSGIDEDNLLAFSRFGDTLRFTATAEISGYSTNYSQKDFKHIKKTAKELIPEGADFNNIEYWTGLRPMTPQGTPIIGYAKHSNLLYNTGHGHLGCTMASGSAKVIADLVSRGKTTFCTSNFQPKI